MIKIFCFTIYVLLQHANGQFLEKESYCKKNIHSVDVDSLPYKKGELHPC